MSKPLNQIELGTSCFVKESGQPGTLQRIFYYPTKYLVKTDDGEFQYYSTHEITFEGYDRPKTSLSIPDVPYDGLVPIMLCGYLSKRKVRSSITS